MTKTRFVSYLVAIIAGAVAIASALGIAAGIGLYNAIVTPADEQAFLGTLGDALLGLVFGAAVALAAYVVIVVVASRRLPRQLMTGRALTAVLTLPLTVGIASYLTLLVTGDIEGPLYYLVPVFWAAVVLTLALGLVADRIKLMVVAAVFLVLVGAGFANHVRQNREYAQSFTSWNGPLVLVNGNTAQLGQPGWNPLYVDAPYSNDSYETVNLQWRRVNSDQSEDNLVVKMSNQQLDDGPCSYDSCEVVGTSKFGPVYQSTTDFDYVVAVQGGSLSVDSLQYDGNVIDVINSLDEVTPDQFSTATAGLQD